MLVWRASSCHLRTKKTFLTCQTTSLRAWRSTLWITTAKSIPSFYHTTSCNLLSTTALTTSQNGARLLSLQDPKPVHYHRRLIVVLLVVSKIHSRSDSCFDCKHAMWILRSWVFQQCPEKQLAVWSLTCMSCSASSSTATTGLLNVGRHKITELEPCSVKDGHTA